MTEIIRIEDDFDLGKIASSGQIFRARQIDDCGTWRFIHRGQVLDIRALQPTEAEHKKVGEGEEGKAGAEGEASLSTAGVVDRRYVSRGSSDTFAISCDLVQWKAVWMPYFDLNRSYADVRDRGRGKSGFVDASMDFGQGLRVLQQDPWEMLVTFIISQRKSMPAIATSVEALCEKFGESIALLGGGEAMAFPTAEALAAATDDDLRACSLGYRAPYVADAARRVVDGDLDLDAAAAMGDVELFEYLQTVHGVGKKVANCVCLFGFGRTSLVPVDVWIARAIDERCDGCDPFAQYGADAGIMQQYVFYYMTQTRGK